MCLVYLLKITKMRNLQDEIERRKCLTCNNQNSSPFASIFDHPSLLFSLSEVLGVKVKREKYYPETLCYQCCCFVNRVMEFRRIGQIRMQDFKTKYNNGRVIFNGVDRTNPKLSIDHHSTNQVSLLQNGEKETTVDQTPPKSKLFGQNEHFKNAGFSGPIIASVQTGVSLSPINAMDDDDDVVSTTTTNNSNQSHQMNGDGADTSMLTSTANSSRLLLPMFECSESVIDTESGGNIDLHNAQQSGKTAPHKTSSPSYFTCPHCNKVYRKLVSLEKHVRRHERKMRMEEAHRRSREIAANADTSAIAHKTYECEECKKMFENKHELRMHDKSHRKRYDCEHCEKKFYNSADFEWHQAICDGIRRARKDEDSSLCGRRQTRSRHGRLSVTPDYEDYDYDDEEDDYDNMSDFSALSTPSYSAKIQSINRWIQNGKRHSPPPQSEHLGASSIGGDSDMDDRMSVVSGLTNITNLSDFSYCPSMAFGSSMDDRRSYISIRTKYSNKSKSSVGDLMSARTTLSSRTLTRGISRKISKIDLELSFRGNGDNTRIDKMQQRNKKLMRLRNREAKQLMKNGATVFLCTQCIFSCDSLAMMMQHEKKKHNMLALYKCPECIERFTQEKYLNQHILMHPSGPFYCIHCEENFDTKFELKVHLDLHLEKSHSCQYCDLSFLKLSQMKQHILTAHLDRLNVNNDDASATITKTGIIYRENFNKQYVRNAKTKNTVERDNVERKKRLDCDVRRQYKVKTLVQKRISSDEHKKRRIHYPYLEKLGNIDSKLVQMLRSGNISSQTFTSESSSNIDSSNNDAREEEEEVVVDVQPESLEVDDQNKNPVETDEALCTNAAKTPTFETTETEPSHSKNYCDTEFDFEVPDEIENEMTLDEHGVFSVDAIPDPDKATTTYAEDLIALLQSPPYSADDTPCSSNGNTPPYVTDDDNQLQPSHFNNNNDDHNTPNNSPSNSANTSPTKRQYHRKKSKYRINVNSKRITKQIVQNNLKLNHLYLESNILPSYTLLFYTNNSNHYVERAPKKSRKQVNSNSSVTSRHSMKDGPWRA